MTTPKQMLDFIKKYIHLDGYNMLIDLEKSQGSWLYDRLHDTKYLDFFSFFASAPIGFNHPETLNDPDFQTKLSRAALSKVSNSDFYTEEYYQFVKMFSEVAIPPKFQHLFLISGGALAVENALKATFDWKVRKNFENGSDKEIGSSILHFEEAFHGRSGYTLSLTNTADPRKFKYFPKFSWPRVKNPKITFPLEENLEHVKELETQSLSEIHEQFSKHNSDIAGIIIEPIQGEGGDNHFRPEFFKQLREIADEMEAMLIFDEVQTGIGMTGKMWGFEHTGIEPDMIAFGKKMQICGFLANERINEVENNVFQESSRINSTWGGNLVDMVRSTKYLEIIQRNNLVHNAKKMGNQLLKGLNDIAESTDGFISNIRGKGLFVAFDMDTPDLRDDFIKDMLRQKVILLKSGASSVRFRPPLSINADEIGIGLTKIEEVLRPMN